MLEVTKPVVIVEKPTITLLARTELVSQGVIEMAEWVQAHRPDCVPESGFRNIYDLLPHNAYDQPHDPIADHEASSARVVSDGELLVEIGGRKCYDSFAERAGKKTNREYLANIQAAGHTSVLYHAKLTFFFAGVSRKFSHQFIRNYVGSDREEEGAPSQESTRYTHHYGHYVVPPYILAIEDPERRRALLATFRAESQANAETYRAFIRRELESETVLREGHLPVATARRKEIMEAAAGLLSMSAETSFVWTSNPVALTKFMVERGSPHADAEMQRFTRQLGPICFREQSNLFQDPRLDFLR